MAFYYLFSQFYEENILGKDFKNSIEGGAKWKWEYARWKKSKIKEKQWKSVSAIKRNWREKAKYYYVDCDCSPANPDTRNTRVRATLNGANALARPSQIQNPIELFAVLIMHFQMWPHFFGGLHYASSTMCRLVQDDARSNLRKRRYFSVSIKLFSVSLSPGPGNVRMCRSDIDFYLHNF